MNLSQLRYFVQLSHIRHYTKAAEQLYITQPSLSQAIKKLEEELGVPLFERDSAGLELTTLGKRFLGDVESALEILDNSVDYIQRSAQGNGVVRLGVMRMLGTDYAPNLIRDFLDNNSDKNIEFVIHVGTAKELLDKLHQREVDIVMCSETFSQYKYRREPLLNKELFLIVPKKHPFANRKTIDLAETIHEPFVKFTYRTGLRHVIDNLYHKIGTEPPTAYEIQEDQVVAGMVSGGFGIGIVPYMDILPHLDVKILQITNPKAEWPFYMVTDPAVSLSPVEQNFWDYVLSRREF